MGLGLLSKVDESCADCENNKTRGDVVRNNSIYFWGNAADEALWRGLNAGAEAVARRHEGPGLQLAAAHRAEAAADRQEYAGGSSAGR